MTDKMAQKVAEKLKEVRLEKGMTQADIAEKAGLHPNSYAKIERGEATPSLETLEKIAKALSVRSSDLLPF